MSLRGTINICSILLLSLAVGQRGVAGELRRDETVSRG